MTINELRLNGMGEFICCCCCCCLTFSNVATLVSMPNEFIVLVLDLGVVRKNVLVSNFLNPMSESLAVWWDDVDCEKWISNGLCMSKLLVDRSNSNSSSLLSSSPLVGIKKDDFCSCCCCGCKEDDSDPSTTTDE